MKTSVCLAMSAALVVVAGPLKNRAVHTEFVTDIVYVTVTGGIEHTSSAAPDQQMTVSTSKSQLATKATDLPSPLPTADSSPEPQPEPQLQKPPTKNIKASNTFANTAVYHHNVHRENNSVAALEWDDSYASYAAETAKSCKFEHDLTPGGGGYGQNLAMWGSSNNPEALGANTAIARAITNMWYNGEIVLYPSENYGKPNPTAGSFEAYGHYTQLVWADSKKVGCHAQYCPPGTMFKDLGAWYSVCNYYPAGNMGGEYGNNVLRPLRKQTITA